VGGASFIRLADETVCFVLYIYGLTRFFDSVVQSL